ncbi:MAG: L,D-transpeptidase family protein [Hyphomicrobiaceae bacterium]
MPRLRLRTLSRSTPTGHLEYGPLRLRCAVGRSGIGVRKREGDGATPAGIWSFVEVRWRPDRGRRPSCCLPVRVIRPDQGWCDAPADRNYNRPVRLPYPASAERLWREDHLYDVFVVLDHNRRPRVRGLGSAIFVHAARPGYAPTEGCIALAPRDLHLLLGRVARRSRLYVAPAANA